MWFSSAQWHGFQPKDWSRQGKIVPDLNRKTCQLSSRFWNSVLRKEGEQSPSIRVYIFFRARIHFEYSAQTALLNFWKGSILEFPRCLAAQTQQRRKTPKRHDNFSWFIQRLTFQKGILHGHQCLTPLCNSTISSFTRSATSYSCLSLRGLFCGYPILLSDSSHPSV